MGFRGDSQTYYGRGYSPAALRQAQEEKKKQEQKRVAALKAQGRNADGSYIRPGWESNLQTTGANAGLLKDPYLVGQNYQKAQLDTRGLDQFRNEALRTPGQDSAFAKMALEKQQMEQQRQLNQAAGTMNANVAGMMDNLAAQGGLGGGSRERLAKSGLRDLMRGRQDINSQGAMAQNNIRMQDEQNRINMLGQIPGMDMNKANFDRTQNQDMLRIQETNINNALGERNAKRGDDMEAWKTNMQTWAQNKMADAQSRAGGGGGSGCFITTAVCEASGKPDNCDELETLRWFRDNVMKLDEQMSADVKEYYEIAPKIVEKMKLDENCEEVFEALKQSYICPAVALVKQGEHSLAYEVYRDMVLTLKQKYLN